MYEKLCLLVLVLHPEISTIEANTGEIGQKCERYTEELEVVRVWSGYGLTCGFGETGKTSAVKLSLR
jgi:hypothetical protein